MIAAVSAAFAAATVTSLSAWYLVRRAEDRRLDDAAVAFANEIDEERNLAENVPVSRLLSDELDETSHSGITFAIYEHDVLVTGDARLPQARARGCATAASVRACAVFAERRKAWVIAGAAHSSLLTPLLLAAALAALVAAVGAWGASRPLAARIVGPLTKLREHLAAIDVAHAREANLGEPTGVAEVDALRETMLELLARVDSAVARAERFAADAAHELRTPLTAIRGELELLADDALSVESKTDLRRARLQVLQLQTLVERLLVLAAPTEQHSSVRELVSMQDVVEDVVTTLDAASRARVTIAEPEGSVALRGDTTLLGVLVTNVLANALKFGEHVNISVHESGDTVTLRVEDDGPGVAVGDRERVFEAFARGASARERRVPGHGLGLALVAHIARRHGGRARFVDAPRGALLEVQLMRQTAR